ncbi:MAG: putative methyltransferase-domain-containing protein [Benniella sp.]|nr:MAG: putative methyltransferase-domain-containing protein [Benniella sp.]
MSNHPENLDIHDSVGPPTGIVPLAVSDPSEVEKDSAMISVMQDIATFGIAGRIWDSSYVLDVYLRHPTDQYTFWPPCPIPRECFTPPNLALSIPRNHEPEATGSEATSTTISSGSTGETNAVGMTLNSLPPIRILEVGAGTGYVGIALAKRLQPNCTLILTDLEEVVPLMEKNVAQHLPNNNNNQDWADKVAPVATSASAAVDASPEQKMTTVTTMRQCAHVLVEPLAWGNSDHATKILAAGKIEYIIASDLVYFPELYPPLLATLREITVVGETKVIFGYRERAPWKETPFWEEFGRYFEIKVVRIEKHKGKNVDHDQGRDQGQDRDQEEDEDEDPISVFGCDGEDRMYVFVCTKRRDEDILEGADDTLATLSMMLMGY